MKRPASFNTCTESRQFTDAAVFILVALFVFAIYLLTMAPDVTWSHWGADGSDFVLAVVRRQLPHPPGFPVYLMIARLFTHLPLKSVSWRMNLFSSLMATGAVLMTMLALKARNISLGSVILTGLCLGFAPLFWSQALITEVYTTAAFFVSVTHYLNIKDTRYSWMAWLVWGIAVAVHPITAVTLLYFLVWQPQKWKGIIIGLLAAILLYVFLLYWGTGVQKWADFRTFRGWFDYVSGRLYWDYAFTLAPNQMLRRSISWLVLLIRQFTPIGGVCVIVGLYDIWQDLKRLSLGILLCIGILSLYVILYNSNDSFIYLVPVMPVLALALGKGMDWFIGKKIPAFAWAIIPVLLIVINARALSLRTDHNATLWLQDTLSQLPEHAITISEADNHTFTIWYALEVLGLREDILFIDKRLWYYAPYQHYIRTVYGISSLEAALQNNTHPRCVINDKGALCN